MSEPIKLPDIREYTLTVENTVLRLLLAPVSAEAESGAGDISDLTMHSHFYTEVFVCTAGGITVAAGSGAFSLGPGDAAVIPVGLAHNKLPSAGHVCWRSLAFTFTRRRAKDCRDLFSGLQKLSSGREAVIFRDVPDLCRLFTDLCLSPSDSDCFFALRMAGVIASLYEIYRDREDVSSRSAAVTESSGINRLSRLDQLLNTCFMNDISVSEIAQKLFVSKRQLSRIALKRFGMTLHRAVIDKRIVTAEQLLRNTPLPVEKLAGIVGFSSKSAFYREFAKKYAATPAKYRKTHCI